MTGPRRSRIAYVSPELEAELEAGMTPRDALDVRLTLAEGELRKHRDDIALLKRRLDVLVKANERCTCRRPPGRMGRGPMT